MINSVVMVGPGRGAFLADPEKSNVQGLREKKPTHTDVHRPKNQNQMSLFIVKSKPFLYVYLYRIFAEDGSTQQLKVHWSDR